MNQQTVIETMQVPWSPVCQVDKELNHNTIKYIKISMIALIALDDGV